MMTLVFCVHTKVELNFNSFHIWLPKEKSKGLLFSTSKISGSFSPKSFFYDLKNGKKMVLVFEIFDI